MIWPLLFIAISASASTFRISREVLSDRAEVVFHATDRGIVRERNSNAFGNQNDHGYGRSFSKKSPELRKISSELAALSSIIKKSDSILRSFGEQGMSGLIDPGARTMKLEIDGISLVPGSKDYQRALSLAEKLLSEDWVLADGQIITSQPPTLKSVKKGKTASTENFDPIHFCARSSTATICKFSGTGPVFLE